MSTLAAEGEELDSSKSRLKTAGYQVLEPEEQQVVEREEQQVLECEGQPVREPGQLVREPEEEQTSLHSLLIFASYLLVRWSAASHHEVSRPVEEVAFPSDRRRAQTP